ncbi:MAG: carboxypeptidase-like regulatory domain-containing protein [Hyphomicrobiales bacterium]
MRYFILATILLMYCNISFGQKETYSINGVIKNKRTGLPIQNAHVIGKGIMKGTTSNNYGQFKMKVYNPDTLFISYIGFKETTYPISDSVLQNQVNINIFLQEDTTTLNEVNIYPFPTYHEFKKQLIYMEDRPTPKINSSIIELFPKPKPRMEIPGKFKLKMIASPIQTTYDLFFDKKIKLARKLRKNRKKMMKYYDKIGADSLKNILLNEQQRLDSALYLKP